MIRLWNYRCEKCGQSYPDWPVTTERVPRTIKCQCGARAGWARQKRMAQVHRSLSTLYDKRNPDPQTGEFYTSYEDKKRKLKAHGLVEGEIERLDDILASTEPPPKEERDPNVHTIDADSEEDAIRQIRHQLYSDERVDRRQVGNPRPMLDSWFSLKT